MVLRDNFVYRRRMDYGMVVFVLLLQVWTSIGAWTTLNVTVSRGIRAGDAFAFTSPKEGDRSCHVMSQSTCARSGGLPTNQQCDSQECCRTCRCTHERPTYLTHKNRCVSDKNFTTALGSKPVCEFYLAENTSSRASCSKPTLPTLDTRISGQRSFVICGPDVEILSDINLRSCEVKPYKSHYLDNGKWISLKTDTPTRRVVKHGFTLNKLDLQWSGNVNPALHGRIVSLAITCVRFRWTVQTGAIYYPINSCITFKTAGSRSWPGPRVPAPDTSTPSPSPPPTSNHSKQSVVMPTRATTPIVTGGVTSFPVMPTEESESEERMNVVQVSGDIGMLLIIVAAVLGSLLVLVFGAICVGLVLLRKRRQRANISVRRKKNASNPVYERGPDRRLMTEDSRNTSLYTNYTMPGNFYQPLVENSRPAWGAGKYPIYESLGGPRATTDSLIDANRVSLPYCDMTDDGYLVPVDGHTYPTPPPSGSEGNTTDMTTISNHSCSLESQPRVSYNYDEPEGILKEKPAPVLKPAAGELVSVSDPTAGELVPVLDPAAGESVPGAEELVSVSDPTAGESVLVSDPEAEELAFVDPEKGELSTASDPSSTGELVVSDPTQGQLDVPHSSGESDNESYYEDMKDFDLNVEKGTPFYYFLQNPDKGTKKTKRRKKDSKHEDCKAETGKRENKQNDDAPTQEEENTKPTEATETVNKEADTLLMQCTCAKDDSTKL